MKQTISEINLTGDSFMDQSIIDWEHLHQLTGNNLAFEIDLLHTFLEDATFYVEEIQKALNQRDFSALTDRAHQLKGSSATIAVRKMPDLAADLEKKANLDHLEEAQHLINQLHLILTQIQDLLDQQPQ